MWLRGEVAEAEHNMLEAVLLFAAIVTAALVVALGYVISSS